jgi:hypothetical protein
MAPRTSVTAACTLAAVALLLTGCGGGGSSAITGASQPPPGTAAGAPGGATTPPASPTATAPSAPVFHFPPDVKVVVDPDVTGDAVKDAILRDQGNGLRAIYLALAKLDTRSPGLAQYLAQDAAKTWDDSVGWGRTYHRSVTGTVRFYDREVTVKDQKTAGVSFCEDQSRSYDKDSKTGKVFTTQPSASDFVFHMAQMIKASDGTWQMATYKSQRGAARCRH